MKKLLYISFIFAFVLAFTSCEKEVIQPGMDNDTEFLTPSGQRGGEGGIMESVTDPDEDEDFDDDDENEEIVDPDEDEDFDKNENDGK